jgi:hypothetical protein
MTEKYYAPLMIMPSAQATVSNNIGSNQVTEVNFDGLFDGCVGVIAVFNNIDNAKKAFPNAIINTFERIEQ